MKIKKFKLLMLASVVLGLGMVSSVSASTTDATCQGAKYQCDAIYEAMKKIQQVPSISLDSKYQQMKSLFDDLKCRCPNDNGCPEIDDRATVCLAKNDTASCTAICDVKESVLSMEGRSGYDSLLQGVNNLRKNSGCKRCRFYSEFFCKEACAQRGFDDSTFIPQPQPDYDPTHDNQSDSPAPAADSATRREGSIDAATIAAEKNMVVRAFFSSAAKP